MWSFECGEWRDGEVAVLFIRTEIYLLTSIATIATAL